MEGIVGIGEDSAKGKPSSCHAGGEQEVIP